MQRITIFAMQGNTRVVTGGVSSTTLAEGSFPGCTVSVFTTGTTNLATIFGDNLNPPTPKSNPFTADSTGTGFFYAANGTRVDIQLSGTGIVTPFVLAGDVLLEDFSLPSLSAPVTIPFSATPAFDVSLSNWYQITLAGNVTAPTFPNAAAGNLLVMTIIQDAAGAHTWAWPVSFLRPPAIALGTNAVTELTFKFDGLFWRSLAATGDNLQVPSNVVIAGVLTAQGANLLNAKSLEGIRFADQFVGADAGAQIQAAINDLPSTGGIVDASAFTGNIAAASTITINKPCWLRFGGCFFALSGAPGINITSDNVVISGITGSPNSNSLGTILAGNTGTNTVIQTNGFYPFIRDMRITRGVVKTAGSAINITGGGAGVFQNLRIDNTFNGITMTGGGGSFRDITITGSQAMAAGIIIGPVASSTVTSSTFEAIQINGGTATWSDAYVVLDSGTDGMTFLGSQFVQGTNRSTALNVRNTSTSNDPEWNKFVGCDFEGGSDHAGIQIDACRGLSFTGCVIQGLQGILYNGGRDVRINGNQIYRCQNEGIKVTAAVPLLNITGNAFGNNGLATNNTFDDVFINAAATSFNIVVNTFGDIAGDAPANKPRNNINIANTGATGFNIIGNNMETSTAVSGFVANSSTTGHWNIAGNTPVASITNDLRGALTVGGNFGAAGGKFGTNPSGIITSYNNITTVSGGVPSVVATVDLTNQSAAITATIIYTPVASGMFRISYVAAVTTAATTSSILGGTTGLRISYTDPDDSVGKSSPIPGASAAGVNQAFDSYNNQANTTNAQMSGVIVVNAKVGVAIQYAIGYTSVGVTAMVYNLHIKVEAL